MIFLFEVPIIGILVLFLGIFGFDLVPVLFWLGIIGGIFTIIISAILYYDALTNQDKVGPVASIIISVILIILVCILDFSGASFSLYDCLKWFFS